MIPFLHFFFTSKSAGCKIFQVLFESLLPTAPPKVYECWMLVLNRGKLLRSIITGHREREGAAWETKADYLQYIKPLGASGRKTWELLGHHRYYDDDRGEEKTPFAFWFLFAFLFCGVLYFFRHCVFSSFEILQKTAFSLGKSRLALGSPGCLFVRLVGWLSPCGKWPYTQENGCWLPHSDQSWSSWSGRESQPPEHTTVILTKIISNAIQIARNITEKIWN